MASKTVYFSAFGFDGLQLSGLSLAFLSPGYYLINGTPASAPSISEIGSTGTYKFTASLAEGEDLTWRVDLGSSSSSKYAFGDLSYADCLIPVLESEVGPAVLSEAVAGYSSGSVGSLLSSNLDAAVSSRLATSGYTAPNNSDISAIKLKTDNLPSDPADASDVRDLLLAVEGSGFDTAVDSLKEISDGVSSLSTKLGTPSVSVSADLVALQTSVNTGLDVAVSTRLAASAYTAPNNADISAIKAKTDNLPADPADASEVHDLLVAIEGSGFDTATDSLKEISDGVSAISTLLGAPVVSVSADIGAVQTALNVGLDVAVSTRLAASSYTVPDNASITAIKSKTDNLPSDPADASDIRDLLDAVEGSGFDTAVDSLKVLSDGVSDVLVKIGTPSVSISSDLSSFKSSVDTKLDVAVSTRLAASDYAEPDLSDLAIIRERTDRLPDSPANELTVASRLAAANYVAPDNTSVAAIKTKTDNLPTDPADASDIRDLLDAVEGSGFDTAVDSLKALSDGVSDVLGRIGTPVTSLSTDLSGFKTSVDAKLDVAVSTRLAASTYVAPDNTGISAIKSKTDNLPSDPADASDITALIQAVEGAGFDTTLSSLQKISEKVGTLVTAVGTPAGASLSSDLSSVKTDTAQINTLTQSKLDATVSSRLAASAYTAPDSATLASIKAKTDLIPDDPAQQPTVLLVKAKTDQIDVAVSTRLAASAYIPPANSDVGLIRAKTDRFLFDPSNRVYANAEGVSTSPPVVSNFAPAAGTPITDRTPLGFDVTDDSGEFRRIIALVSFSTGQTDVAYDGKNFRGAYSRYSTKSSIPQGFRFTISRDGRWPGSPTLEVIPIDTAGNEGT